MINNKHYEMKITMSKSAECVLTQTQEYKTMYAVIETMQMHDHRVVALFEDYDKAKEFADQGDYYYIDEIPVLE